MSEPTTLRIRIETVRPAFAPRARWVLETLAEALGREPAFVDGPAELVYGPDRPAEGVWIPADPAAQAFFEGQRPFPATAVHRARDLTLLFPPGHPEEPLPGDLVASAFYLLARWDERWSPGRDPGGRLALAASAFGRIAGLDLDEPAVEDYVGSLRAALRIRPPAGFGAALVHEAPARRTAAALPDLVEAAWRRGLRATVFLRGDSPAAAAAAVRAGGGAVGLLAEGGAGSDPAGQLAALRASAGEPVEAARVRDLGYHERAALLERIGVACDCSLGFAEAPGFAAGIARPFAPYLLGEERPARLRTVPVALSEESLRAGLGLDAEAAGQRALKLVERIRVAGGRAAIAWRDTRPGERGGYGDLWEELLDRLAARRARLDPVGPARPAPPGARLDGTRVLHLTTVHRPRDVRIFHKEARALRAAGARVEVLAPARPLRRLRRLAAGWRIAGEARRREAHVYHVHDPELLPAALWLARSSGRPVIYDVHEYLGQTARTKRWLPAPARLPIALVAERFERWAASRLAAAVTANEDLAARFAAAGARAVSVANSPWSDAFPEPAPPAPEPVALYVGGLGPLRGLEVMRRAFPRVEVTGARLVLAGPGDPGELPSGVEHLGPVDHSRVPALLAGARLAWVPLQRHGNYDRAVPTKLVEAMAAGRPVVASDLGRMGAIVRASGCGVLVPPADPDAHAQALTQLLGDPERAAAMGAAGRAAFLAGLDFAPEARALTSLYAEVLGG